MKVQDDGISDIYGFWSCYSTEMVTLAEFANDLHVTKCSKHFSVSIFPDLSIALNSVDHVLISLTHRP